MIVHSINLLRYYPPNRIHSSSLGSRDLEISSPSLSVLSERIAESSCASMYVQKYHQTHCLHVDTTRSPKKQKHRFRSTTRTLYINQHREGDFL